jgi:hypothetical protein
MLNVGDQATFLTAIFGKIAFSPLRAATGYIR